jgi:polysaccharide biosynthesis protein PslG
VQNPDRQQVTNNPGTPSCASRLTGYVLLLASATLALWTLLTHTPWSEPDTRPAIASPQTIPHTNVNPYSVNTFLSLEVEPWKREKTVEMIADAGIGWIKEGFPWSEIEPAQNSHWDAENQQDSWQKYDEIVDLAEQYGIRIIARLDHTPEWARDGGSDFHTPPTDPDDYARFVEAFVERYQGRVQFIQIWNEPNLAREWGDDIDPEGYFELLRGAYTRAKNADPNVVILSAPMAMTNETSARAIPEFDYWGELYELGVADYFDVLTATGYGINQPPEQEPTGEVINLRRIELLREIMDRFDDGDKPIWLTEYGWNAAPESIEDDSLEWGRVSEQEQAEWTARGIRWMSEQWDWFGVASTWYFRQVGNIPPDSPEYYFAMVELEFTPRPIYLELREDARAARIALPGTYGPMEAPIQQSGRWARVDDQTAPFGETIVTDTWGSEVRVEFSGTDLKLIPGDLSDASGWMYVTLNGEPAQKELFSVDHLGRTYLDLDELPDNIAEIPVVRNYGTSAPQEDNVFVLHIHEGASMSLRGITVEYHRTYRQFALFSGISAVGLVGSMVIIRRRSMRA